MTFSGIEKFTIMPKYRTNARVPVTFFAVELN